MSNYSGSAAIQAKKKAFRGRVSVAVDLFWRKPELKRKDKSRTLTISG
jgi:hypothetical protein